jgi:predicted anti-sigma-YlaC factor YlaD
MSWRRHDGSFRPAVVIVILLTTTAPACSVKKMAINRLGDALSQGGRTFATDDDPDLVGAAVPFALKTTEGLLAQAPRHEGLLLAAASGFTQYAYGWVQIPADELEDSDLSRATAMRARGRRLYERARAYGLRGLELRCPDLRSRLRAAPAEAAQRFEKRDVPLLYWTALAWFGAINLAKDDPALSADQYQAEALMRRALALDETYERGVLHDFFIAWEGRGAAAGGSPPRARAHFERAVALSNGQRASSYVALAESVCVKEQDRSCFDTAIERALAVDFERQPDDRLNNVISQRRARWLRGRVDELFAE